MDLGMTTASPANHHYTEQCSSRSSKDQTRSMSNGHSQSHAPGTPNKHVNFGQSNGTEEKKREKFLTAKYGAHQMALIRKRLRVEMWMYERLQEMYGKDHVEIDLDEVLDMDSEMERRQYICNLLKNTHGTKESIFVGDLLEKVKTL